MKKLLKLSGKAQKWCEMSGFDANLIKQNMKCASFAILVCETKEEMDENGVDYAYPYAVWNPHDLKIKL